MAKRRKQKKMKGVMPPRSWDSASLRSRDVIMDVLGKIRSVPRPPKGKGSK